MRTLRPIVLLTIAGILFPAGLLSAQSNNSQQAAPPGPTFSITSTLVFLDVTVLDKKGNPVVTGLTKSDFHITEDKKPQRIFSFEAPQVHVMGPNANVDNPHGKAPVNILVLDLLDSTFNDFAYIRYQARKFLMSQPALLSAPAELMVLGNDSLDMLQGFTRNRDDLVHALDRLPPAIPFEKTNSWFAWDRFSQSVDALQQIALENKGVPGRKNVIWIGHGGPGIFFDNADLTGQDIIGLREYAHQTTNMLVDSRITLFVIYPGLHINPGRGLTMSSMDSGADLSEDDPFSGDVNFGLFVNTTGGKLYFNRNDLAHLMGRAEQLGSQYYTLTYQPTDRADNGKFRRILVTVDNRNYRVVTKAGYFAPDPYMNASPQQQMLNDIVEAANSSVPFTALGLSMKSMIRHPDTRTLDMTVQLQDRNLSWFGTPDGRSQARLLLAAFSIANDGRILAAHIERVSFLTSLQDPVARAALVTPMSITVHFPRKAQHLRVVAESEDGGRIGTVDLTRKAIQAVPAKPTPLPQLQHRPHRYRPEYVPNSPPAP